MNKKRKLCFSVLFIILTFFLIMLGPLDYFSHGFFYDEIDCKQIADEDYENTYDLGTDDFEMQFSPQKRHFAGFEIYLTNQPDGNKGILSLTITDKSGKVLDVADIDLNKIHAKTWYKVYTSASLKPGAVYELKISASNCDTFPYLQGVNTDYLKPETISGNILLSYAYEESTFSFQEKILFLFFSVSLVLFLYSMLAGEKKKSACQVLSVLLLMIGVLTWNYMYNSMDNQNEGFEKSLIDSETLVTGMIYAEEDGTYFQEKDEYGFGMGRYYNLRWSLESYDLDYLSDKNWIKGYSKTKSAVVVNSNIYSKEMAKTGNYMLFKNGDIYKIRSTEDNNIYINIFLDTKKLLTSEKNGSLDDVRFFDSNMHPLAKSKITAYKSQYGLNGKIFRHMARYIDDEQEIATLNLICSILTAAIFSFIVLLIYVKYNKVMACCFFSVFWLSPWIVNFARNLYWVEFTWFVPMLVGLICSLKIENKKFRILSYVAAFLSIFIKCLCGYEYISVIMMALIGFLLVDLIKSYYEKDMGQYLLLLRTIIVLGCAALAGFMAAVFIHAPLRGNGSFILGIKTIIKQDVLRRTTGGNLNDFAEVLWPSFNASIWETFSKYFHFNTEIITGIIGNLFPLLCIGPLCIFFCDYSKKNIRIDEIALYTVFFLTSVSWFCLAKGHSYIHTHMNYVLWYFGFIQICFYIIINRLLGLLKRTETSQKGDL